MLKIESLSYACLTHANVWEWKPCSCTQVVKSRIFIASHMRIHISTTVSRESVGEVGLFMWFVFRTCIHLLAYNMIAKINVYLLTPKRSPCDSIILKRGGGFVHVICVLYVHLPVCVQCYITATSYDVLSYVNVWESMGSLAAVHRL